MAKLFVWGSLDIASCFLAVFPPHLLVSEGDLGVVLPGTPFVWVFVCFFVLLGEVFILCSVHLAVVAPHVSGNAVLKTVFRYLVSFTVLFL